jgi:hypothetical protein
VEETIYIIEEDEFEQEIVKVGLPFSELLH